VEVPGGCSPPAKRPGKTSAPGLGRRRPSRLGEGEGERERERERERGDGGGKRDAADGRGRRMHRRRY